MKDSEKRKITLLLDKLVLSECGVCNALMRNEDITNLQTYQDRLVEKILAAIHLMVLQAETKAISEYNDVIREVLGEQNATTTDRG